MQHQRRYLSTLAGFRQTCHAFVNRCIWPKRLWQGTMDSFDDWGQSPKPKVPDSGFDTFKRCMGTLPPRQTQNGRHMLRLDFRVFIATPLCLHDIRFASMSAVLRR